MKLIVILMVNFFFFFEGASASSTVGNGTCVGEETFSNPVLNFIYNLFTNILKTIQNAFDDAHGGGTTPNTTSSN